MKKIIFALLATLPLSAFAGETDALGLLTLQCQAKDQATIQVEVFNNIQDMTDAHVYAKNPMGFIGRGIETKTQADHLIVNLPVMSQKDSITLDVDLSAHACKPDAVLKDSFGNSMPMSCIYSGATCTSLR